LAARGRLEVTGLVTVGSALTVVLPEGLAAAEQLFAEDPDAIMVSLGRSGFDASTYDPTLLCGHGV
jgi:hypothetical protein